MTHSFALVSRVAQVIHRQSLFNSGDTLVVAVSGGADSTALLDILANLPDYNFNLIIAHLNHCLRGAESDADEEFCRELAVRYSAVFENRRIDVAKMAEEQRLNLEDAGRRARIDFFDAIRLKYSAAAVVLAHHADDQAETVLQRLLRGAGMNGLSGMTYRNDRGYVRLLLEVTRVEIEQYLRKQGLSWRDDASNRDTIYLRNRIRHQLLPLLEEYNPAIRANLVATASIIGDDETFLEQLAVQEFAASCLVGRGRVVCSVSSLQALHIALRRRVLRLAYKQLIGNLDGLGQCHIAALCDLMDSNKPNSQISLPQLVTARREYDQLILAHKNGSNLVAEVGFEIMITEPGCYQLPSGDSVLVEVVDGTSFTSKPDRQCFDLSKLPFPWQLRNFNPGDRIIPFGMTGRKKVKEIFIEHKIPVAERRRLPLLFCCADLVWVAGLCSSELSRIGESAKILVTASYIRN